MFSLKIKYFLYGSLVSASLITIATQAASSDGVFGDYFQNMITDAGSCGINTVITGFEGTSGSTYGTQECTTFQNIVNTALKTFGSASTGQAVIGFNPTTGAPIYGDVNWHRSGTDVSYIGGNIGIGTATPSTRLEVNGSIKASGATSDIDANRNIWAQTFLDRNNGSYFLDPDSTSILKQLNVQTLCLNGDCKTSWPTATVGAGYEVYNHTAWGSYSNTSGSRPIIVMAHGGDANSCNGNTDNSYYLSAYVGGVQMVASIDNGHTRYRKTSLTFIVPPNTAYQLYSYPYECGGGPGRFYVTAYKL